MSRYARLVPITALNGSAEDSSSANRILNSVLEPDALSSAKSVVREQVRAAER